MATTGFVSLFGEPFVSIIGLNYFFAQNAVFSEECREELSSIVFNCVQLVCYNAMAIAVALRESVTDSLSTGALASAQDWLQKLCSSVSELSLRAFECLDLLS